eukprot:CAMPEP_0115482822 /NCGR_PEP_ID=MMETSP0271-20121206/58531_1 /TAXON_ID=71861 /ORGANISM="Scrippsiella trochoidea, Strain CCMP3099" /LENGTH=50 /DNA_ID=CAMNT_0002910639 /DNA_START=91 /DNA_END=243 /DNA_ORIENTATION=-
MQATPEKVPIPARPAHAWTWRRDSCGALQQLEPIRVATWTAATAARPTPA